MGGRHYDRNELQMITILRQGGLSIPVVARQLGRTPKSIQGVLTDSGLG
jgi:hypothetical protein